MAQQDAMRRPAAWERLLAVILWLVVSVALVVLPGWYPLIVLALTVSLYVMLRKRRPFAAKHCLLASCCWLFLPVYAFCTYGIAILTGVGQARLEQLVSTTLPRLIEEPNLIPVFWQALDAQMHGVILALLAGVALNVLLALTGVGAALLGRRGAPPVKQQVPRRAAAARS